MTSKISFYRTRPLPLNAKLTALLQSADELHVICNGQWSFLAGELLDRRMHDEDQDVPLWPELRKAWSKVWLTYQRTSTFDVAELEYDLTVAFSRVDIQTWRWAATRWACGHIGKFCDAGSLKRLFTPKHQTPVCV